MPVHHYARLSAAYLQPNGPNRTAETPDILTLALTTRAYTRVVLRLRTQAESEARYLRTLQSTEPAQPRNNFHPGTRRPSVSSRAPSPTTSNSHSHNHSNEKAERNNSFSSQVSKFRSPLYRIGRAPVLRVFVPSPEGDWLSDASVVECEAELKRSSVLKLLRVGDIVWDVAVGDEGNQGRLIWDGSYLVVRAFVFCMDTCGVAASGLTYGVCCCRIWITDTPVWANSRLISTAWRSLLPTSTGSSESVDRPATTPIVIQSFTLT